MQSVKQALLGCLEIPLFMSSGVRRFSDKREFAIFSFLVPLFLIIPTAFLSQINPDFQARSFGSNLLRLFELFILSSIMFFTIVYFCFQALERQSEFFKFMGALNWLNLSFFLINLPFNLLVYTHVYTFKEMHNLLIFLMFFAVTCNAFLTTHLVRINWMLATSLSILALLVEDSVMKTLSELN